MALHFLVTDYGLNEDHKKPYRAIGRWMLAAAVMIGLGVGTPRKSPKPPSPSSWPSWPGRDPERAQGGGANERQSRFWAFAAGMAAMRPCC